MKKLTHIYQNKQWIQVGEVNMLDLSTKIDKGSLGLINGLSIEDGYNIDIDPCPFLFVEYLPEEWDDINKNKIYILLKPDTTDMLAGMLDIDAYFDNTKFATFGKLDKDFFNRLVLSAGQVPDRPDVEWPGTDDNDDPSIGVGGDTSSGGDTSTEEPEEPEYRWVFDKNSKFPILLSGGEAYSEYNLYGANMSVVETGAILYVFRVVDEDNKTGYWQRISVASNENSGSTINPDDLRDYLTKTEAASQYQKKGDYITQADAYNTFQRKGNYVSEEYLIEYYITKSDIEETYQEKGDYLLKDIADVMYQEKGDYSLISETAYKISAIPEKEFTTVQLKTKDDSMISDITLTAATEEKAGLMTADDKKTIGMLEDRIKYLMEMVAKLISTPAVYDESNYDEAVYQSDADTGTYDKIGTFIVFSTDEDGSTVKVKQVLTYKYNSNGNLSGLFIVPDEELQDAIAKLKIIDPGSLMSNEEYAFVNDVNSTSAATLSEIQKQLDPKFKIQDNNKVYYKNDSGYWTYMCDLAAIQSLDTITEIRLDVDYTDGHIYYEADKEQSIVSMEMDEDGFFNIVI